MITSMTGFNAVTTTIPLAGPLPLSITISLKTLNSRFFEMTCKLPHALSHLETEINKRCKEKFIRGSVFCTIYILNPNILKSEITPALNVVKGYLDAVKTMQKQFDLPGTLSINDLVALPNVFDMPAEVMPETSQHQLLTIFDSVVAAVVQERQQEGAALGNDLKGRIDTMRSIALQIEPRAEIVIQERRAKLAQEVATVLSAEQQKEMDYQLKQIYAQLERIDIHEEIVRFKTHLENFSLTLTSPDVEKGKKLDFILQEMLRETNTMNAKCADAQISAFAIALKVELEKAREQSQNIV